MSWLSRPVALLRVTLEIIIYIKFKRCRFDFRYLPPHRDHIRLEKPKSRPIIPLHNSSSFPTLNNTKTPWLSADILPRAMSKFEYKQYIKLLSDVTQLLEEYSVTYFLSGGSLLGSYVMHDILPWDDRVVLSINHRHRHRVERALIEADEGNIFKYVSNWDIFDSSVNLAVGANRKRTNRNPVEYFVRVYRADSPKAGAAKWGWPYIYLIFHRVMNESYCVDSYPSIKKHIQGNFSLFYPLHKRPFSSLWLPAPSDPRTLLERHYTHFWCHRTSWNHRDEQKQRSKGVDCWKLTKYYPFVWRERVTGGTVEVLRLRRNIIHSVGVPEYYPDSDKTFIF